MTRVLILGHRGMLGDAVFRHLDSYADIECVTTSARWPDEAFKEAVLGSSADYIVNAIGKIPQKGGTASDYETLNVALPLFLDSVGSRVIHPSTDCEFLGTIPPGERYEKDASRDAADAYGRSKAKASAWIEEHGSHTKIIRTSIIGHESGTALSLLDWFLASEGTVRGYSNHYWNGITTLQWAKQALMLIRDWDAYPRLTQIASPECMSKHDVLRIVAKVYGKEISLEPFETPETVNKCLVSDAVLPPLKVQLQDLASLYGKA
ncbi:MAG TPA: sugar nucleotide-binding protein [Candidatus Paceibacterota bacterium]